MFENLKDQLTKAIKKIKGNYEFTESNINPPLKEIRKALMSADVHYKIAKETTQRLKQKLLGQKIGLAVTPADLAIKLMQDELTLLMGAKAAPLNLQGNPAILLVAGLQGAGKTTLVAKLAHKLKEEGKEVLLIACDVYRPGAVAQLQTLAKQINVEVFTGEPDCQEVLAIAQQGMAYAKKSQKKVVIIDTAGRQSLDEKMMEELYQLKNKVKPDETLLVVDGMTGQVAVNIAKRFNEVINFDGIVLTKLDGDTRGGAALSIRETVQKPIKLISVGEKLHQLETFHPDRMAKRILGMGDIVSLVEEAAAVAKADEIKHMRQKLRAKQFDYAFLQLQLRQLKRMGDFTNIISKLPGVKPKVDNITLQQDVLDGLEVLINSMTVWERTHPDSLDLSRKQRLAQGTGYSLQKINKLTKKFNEMRRIMKKINKEGKSYKGFINSLS